MHKDDPGQPAGTFGAHRGAVLKHQSHHTVLQSQFSSYFLQDFSKIHRSSRTLCSCTKCSGFSLLVCIEVKFPTSLGVARQLEEVPETTDDEIHEARYDAR